jgi:hypothetical protein
MSSFKERLLPLVENARGRCHACAHQRTFDLPFGTRYYCRSFHAEMAAEDRADVRDCPRWVPFRPADSSGRGNRAARNPLLAQMVDAEDQLFWHLKCHLETFGADLKTLMLIVQPSLRTADSLTWIDSLDDRFDDAELLPLHEVLDELRALRYESLCELVDRLAHKIS